MTTLKRHVLEWASEECDPDLSALREWFGLSIPQSHRLIYDLLGTGKDRVISPLIPLVFDLLDEEAARCRSCGLRSPRYPNGVICQSCFDQTCEEEIHRLSLEVAP